MVKEFDIGVALEPHADELEVYAEEAEQAQEGRKVIVSFFNRLDKDAEAPQPQDPLQFPWWVISGLAGKFASLYARHLEPPPVFFFFSFLTCLGSILSDRLTLASEVAPQPRLYTLLLGESADDRKSTAGLKTIQFFEDALGRGFQVSYGVGSAEGLQERILEAEDGKLLLFLDEFKAFASKCKIEASVLLPCVNTLFESNRYESRTKRSDIKLDPAYLSILGASTVQTYENIWTSQFLDIGFPNRVLLVPGTGQRREPVPLKIPDTEKAVIKRKLADVLSLVGDQLEMSLIDDAKALYDQWYLNLQRGVHTKRLDVYAMRLMPLLAVNEGKTEVDTEVVQKIIAIADWQLAVREQLDPIDAQSEVAKMEERIRRRLKRGNMTNRLLKQYTHAYRYGLWVYDAAIKNLCKAGEIKFEKQSQTWHLVAKNVAR